MFRIKLSALAFFFQILALFAQTKEKKATPSAEKATDSTTYQPKKLSFEEANLVSSYYTQDGNHSAVTGGIGTEKLTDYSNTFDLKMTRVGKTGRKHSIHLEIGFDHYSSASSDMINPDNSRGGGGRPGGGGNATTGASYSDNRIYPSIGWQVEDKKKGYTFGANGSFSTEYDYTSKGIGLNFSKSSKDKSQEFGVKLGAFFDTWMVIYPYELRPPGYGTGGHDGGGGPGGGGGGGGTIDYTPRNTFNAAFSFAQIVNKKFQMSFMAEPVLQQGLLATKYQRVYFTDGSAKPENLPDQRLKMPVSVRANYFMTDFFLVRSYYRFYTDDWGLQAHTLSVEPVLKITPFLSISPFYRFYAQNNVKYFAPYKEQNTASPYFTSDYDLSKFTSQSYGSGIRYVSNGDDIIGDMNIGSIELRYSHYVRSTDLVSSMVTLALKFK
ncbi:MAG: hypothetical protein RIS64_415 [Bacteroidota bacterium]|jgi:hypothetical protein